MGDAEWWGWWRRRCASWLGGAVHGRWHGVLLQLQHGRDTVGGAFRLGRRMCRDWHRCCLAAACGVCAADACVCSPALQMAQVASPWRWTDEAGAPCRALHAAFQFRLSRGLFMCQGCLWSACAPLCCRTGMAGADPRAYAGGTQAERDVCSSLAASTGHQGTDGTTAAPSCSSGFQSVREQC